MAGRTNIEYVVAKVKEASKMLTAIAYYEAKHMQRVADAQTYSLEIPLRDACVHHADICKRVAERLRTSFNHFIKEIEL